MNLASVLPLAFVMVAGPQFISDRGNSMTMPVQQR